MERFYQLSQYHGIDNYSRLHYGVGFDKVLNPCEQIGDEDLRLGLIDNNHINPRRLMLLPKDRRPIQVLIPETGENCEFALPGKSAIICLTDEGCGPETISEIDVNELPGKPDRRDHLHVATVGKIRNAGWLAYWVPLQLERKILHVRLVPESGKDPTEEDVRRLVEAFTGVR